MPFSVEASYLPFVNIALLQNNIPLVRELTLVNHTGEALADLECCFSSAAGLIKDKTVMVTSLKNEEKLLLHDINIELNYQMLSSITEAMESKLHLEIRSAGKTLFVNDYDLTAFSADQWLGASCLPELLCTFVTPNMPVINQLMTTIAEELKQATGSSAIEGYQEDKTRVYEICSAIYRAIHSWNINYANPSSAFDAPGQRIRFADSIYKYRLGTCLDTTLLFASVMEQCGLHPVIMLQNGHAYIGCHLIERHFSDLPVEDLQAIRKLVDLDEFIVLETTMVTENATFSEAEAAARSQHLNIDDDFQFAIDVFRARLSGIHPLPIKHSTDGVELEVDRLEADKLGKEHKRNLQQELDLSSLQNGDSRPDRITRWTQKLLDLSLRNRLLNVRDTSLIIPLACPDITVFEDKLAANESISLNPLANLLGEKDLHDLAMLRNSEIKSDIKELLDKELQQKRLWTLLSPGEMNKRLTALYRQSRTDQEEGGVNTLFVAIGFLEWKVTPRDEKTYLAPILLVPVRLQRKSIVEGIRLMRLDEETIINETLLELLRSQYRLSVPGLSPLPTDQSGVDVGRIMQIFRQTTREMPGWEVREEARLGHFSFGKFIMWTDMTARADCLRKHPLVNHLIEGGGLFDDGIEVFPPEELNSHLDITSLYCPLSADSSQLAAVIYSTLGKNFVLHGPPGTGKSQTITNIIAQNLALGRRVLFVSEKKAALDVVHKRLSSIGLRPFCLELHSNKAGKTEVLAQFSEAMNVPETLSPSQWDQVTEQLQQVRKELNGYVRALHKVYPNGFSAYDCFSRLQSAPGASGQDKLLEISCLSQSAEEYARAVQVVGDLAQAIEFLDDRALASLESVNEGEWSPVFERNLIEAAEKLKTAADGLQKQLGAFCSSVGLPEKTDEVNDIYRCAGLAEKLKSLPNIPDTLLTAEFPSHAEFLALYVKTAETLAQLKERLKNFNLEKIRGLDTAGIAARIENNARAFALLRFFKNRSLLNELSGLKKLGGAKLTVEELSERLPDFAQWTDCVQRREKMEAQAKSLLGTMWREEEMDLPAIARVITATREILETIQAITGKDARAFEDSLAVLRDILPEAEHHFAHETPARARLNGLLAAWNSFQEQLQVFADFSQAVSRESSLTAIASRLAGILIHSGALRGVMRYRKFRTQAGQCGLAGFAEALESGEIDSGEVQQVFEDAYAQKMLNAVLGESSELSQFSGLTHEQRIRRFCELDDQFTALAQKVVFAKLAATLPRRRSGPCPEGTELGLLKRECEKKARQKPIRQLLSEIPNLAPVLKPCFLMSPLSVAQYLPPDTSAFDLIVFDEASQIPVWDAIGAIARGKQLIVVGDPKQMPPTNFFQKGDSEEDFDEQIDFEDMESILEECLAAGVHSSYLNWHYRSRHEDLIAFSNHYYYGDRLFTFPAARNSDKLGVKFHFVQDGLYDRRNTRTNRPEAQALVSYVFQQLEDLGDRKRSIGIVTFSEAQKNLIEDLLEAERSKHPQLEAYFSDQNEEPLFVKNLENVQGDERDVILFSICYARDIEGKFSMNFGPLNRQGGERRLNVAITRAKEQVVVFSSVHATQIELSRTNAVGAAHLKYFLDYAEKSVHMLSGSSSVAANNELATVIEQFLVRQGYKVERNLGSSEYRIDLAVRNPENHDEFLLGIECDGPNYAAQKTSRDRDHLRHSVLRSLGWHIHQAWSVDWYYDRQQAEKSLLAALEEAKAAEPETALPPPSCAAVPVAEQPDSQAAPVKQNRMFVPARISCNLPQERFYFDSTLPLIRSQMMQVIEQEAPIYERVLKKRITKAWDFTRAGDFIMGILNSALPTCLPITRAGDSAVFWRQDQDPGQYREYRGCLPSDENKRAIDEIPPEELANAMAEVLADFNSCEQDTLFRETVRLFGLSVVTQKARKYLEIGYNVLKQSGRA